MPKKSTGHGHDTRYVRLQKNYCFACGKNNPDGMRLKFTYDEESRLLRLPLPPGQTLHRPARPRPRRHYCNYPRRGYGQGKQAASRVALTSQITVDYLKPVPLNQPLRVESREVRVRGRQHINMAEILNPKGEVLARSRGLFIAIDPQKMFAKFVER